MTTNNNHGGKRENAGRRPAGDQPRIITRSVKLTEEEAAYISEVGTGELWRLLRASKGFREWTKSRRAE